MRIILLAAIFSFFLSSTLFAQKVNKNICQHGIVTSWSSWNETPTTSFASVSEGKEIINRIIEVIGLKPNFDIRAANVPNAAAVAYGGKRYILYNPTFINALVKAAGNEWAAISVLAHEIGHHLNGHTLNGVGSQPGLELEADEFSGFVLRKMGASLQDAQAAMKLIASQRASKTHPAQYDRLTAIAKGWNKAGNGVNSGNIAKSTPQRQSRTTVPSASRTFTPQKTTPQTAIAGKYILGVVNFLSDRSAQYFVTVRHNLVKVKNNQLQVIGKLARLNSRQYPYLIYDEANNQLLVDARGNIVTKRGQRVGSMYAYKS